MQHAGQSSDSNSAELYAEFRAAVSAAKQVTVLTGAGVSAESGIPTFRGATSGRWRGLSVQDLANPAAFARDPSLVWELYHHRRERCLAAAPNAAHLAIAEFQRRCRRRGVRCLLATQNIDRLHHRAGSSGVVELHRTLFQLRCTQCAAVEENYDSPVCPALAGRGQPDLPPPGTLPVPIPQLPACRSCGGLQRPNVVWFGESLDSDDLQRVIDFANGSDLVVTVGTSNSVYPAALIAPEAARRGAALAEFNLDPGAADPAVRFLFVGPCGSTLPKALAE